MSDHIPDVTKMIGETPRTDEQEHFIDSDRGVVDSGLARQLERELNAANERIRLLIAERDTARRQADQNYKLREEFTELLGTDDVERGVAVVREMNERIKRLEEAGDALFELCDADTHQFNIADEIPQRLQAWHKAKEAKP